MPAIEQLLHDARKREIELVTSAVTVTEVAWAASEKSAWRNDRSIEDKINKLWEPGSPVNLVEFHVLVAEEARALMRAALPAYGRRWQDGSRRVASISIGGVGMFSPPPPVKR